VSVGVCGTRTKVTTQFIKCNANFCKYVLITYRRSDVQVRNEDRIDVHEKWVRLRPCTRQPVIVIIGKWLLNSTYHEIGIPGSFAACTAATEQRDSSTARDAISLKLRRKILPEIICAKLHELPSLQRVDVSSYDYLRRILIGRGPIHYP